jgi:hypothetical protein
LLSLIVEVDNAEDDDCGLFFFPFLNECFIFFLNEPNGELFDLDVDKCFDCLALVGVEMTLSFTPLFTFGSPDCSVRSDWFEV